MNNSCDALVIGGGPAGATAACLLARAGWAITVVERSNYPRRKVCGEYMSGTNRPLLDEMGLLDAFDQHAGPEVHRVGLFAAGAELTAELPRPRYGWGRAIPRDELDARLLDRARQAGATVIQPDEVESLTRQNCRWVGQTKSQREISAPIVIAAHGSWHAGELPTQPRRSRPRASDLFGFKAHFRNLALAPGLMPLLAFPGGYGGMVHSGSELVSLSCCVRRDLLARLKQTGMTAGPAVVEHIAKSCIGVRRALTGATHVGPWLAAGPIRPGVRLRWPSGVYAVGNAAGEAHPIVAEGISMAMQSAWVLSRLLIRGDVDVTRAYARSWMRAFGPRLFASAALARWAMSPGALAISLPFVGRFPALLRWGALASGKVTGVVRQKASR